MTAKELFDAGDLSGAIGALTQDVKAAPTDARRRTFLFELYCFAGDLDRADRQLDVIAHQDAMAEAAVQVYRNVLHAERTRRRVLGTGLAPEFLRDPPEDVRLHVEAAARLGGGEIAAAAALLARAEAARPALRGTVDGRTFEDLRDCDDLLAPVLELIVLRDYVWLPFAQLRELELAPPERPRDLLWAPVRLVLDDGTRHRGYVPALYGGSHEHPDDRVKLGRMTDWVADGAGPTRGRGQRLLLVGDDDLPLLELRRLELAPA
jgi:type VI secretion system protein ImpE